MSEGPEMEACLLLLLKDMPRVDAAEGRLEKGCKKLGRDCTMAGLGVMPCKACCSGAINAD